METTKAILTQLQQTLVENYSAQLAGLPMKKTVRETLIDGFRDGVRAGVHHTVEMLGVEVKE